MRLTLLLSFFTLLLAACRAPAATPEAASPTPAASSMPTTAPPPTASLTPAWWQPLPGTTWQIQIDGEAIDLSYPAEAYDVDLFETPAETIAELHRLGRKVICYFSAGSYEEWRPDAAAFQHTGVIGKPLADWPGEHYLDIRRMDVLAPIMTARMDLAVKKGCDAVDPDNVQNFLEPSGFDLTAADQLAYNRWLAAEAHARGLAVGLKNDRPQIPALVNAFDFAVDEECFAYDECAPLQTFIAAGKAVFEIEYETTPEICSQANALGFSVLIKPWELSAERYDCLQDTHN